MGPGPYSPNFYFGLETKSKSKSQVRFLDSPRLSRSRIHQRILKRSQFSPVCKCRKRPRTDSGSLICNRAKIKDGTSLLLSIFRIYVFVAFFLNKAGISIDNFTLPFICFVLIIGLHISIKCKLAKNQITEISMSRLICSFSLRIISFTIIAVNTISVYFS